MTLDELNERQTSNTETVLYAVKIDEPDYMEEVLFSCKGWTNLHELKKSAKLYCNKNGYNRIRISVIDMTTSADFTRTINIK